MLRSWTVTHTSYKINHSFDYNGKLLIYLLACKTCFEEYVCSTTDCFKVVGTVINFKSENIWEVRLVCKNISLNILIVKGIMGSYMTLQLHWSTKMMVKILLNESTSDHIPLKRWHLMALKLKVIFKLQFACIYFLLIPCISLLLSIIAILIVVVIVAVTIAPYEE